MPSAPLDLILSKLPSARQAGENQWLAKCPAHDDRKASLSIGLGDDGRALLRCHAGCTATDIVAAIGLKMVDLMPNGDGKAPTKAPAKPKPVFPTAREAIADLERSHGPRTDLWTYTSVDGNPVGVVVRWNLPDGGKQILPVSRNGSRWSVCGMPTPRPLFYLPELAAAESVIIGEGEKVAGAARAAGLTATTNAHGSNSAAKTDWAPLAGKECIILPDADSPGRKYAEKVAHILHGLEPRPKIKIVELSGLSDGGDLVDWLDAGGTREKLLELVEDAPEWTPARDSTTENNLATAPKTEVRVDSTYPDRPESDAPKSVAYQPFPVGVLPNPLRSTVNVGAATIGCDPAFVALPLLSACAAAIGNSRWIRLKGGWTEPPILWTVLVGESGCLKTPAFKLAVSALRARQARSLRRHTQDIIEYEADIARHDKAFTAWKREPVTDEAPPMKPEQPEAERCVVSDTTVEAMATILMANPRGVLLARDELAGWIGSFDRYAGGKGGGDSAHWLSMHNGESMVVDRKTGQRRTLYVPAASVSITGGVQPGILRRVLGAEHRESGLLARLLLCMPPRRTKVWTEAEILPQDEATIALLFERLFGLESDQDGDGEPRPRIVGLTPKAKQVWVRFFNEHAREHAELSGDLSAAWSKLEGYAARLGLVLHCVRWAAGDQTLQREDQVDEAGIAAGITLSRWFCNEVRRVYAVLGESEEVRERRQLLELIQRKGGEITVRELMRSSRMFGNSTDAEAALGGLVESGDGAWVNQQTGPQGGQPSKYFKLVASTVDTVDVDRTPRAGVASRGIVNVNSVNALADGNGDDWGEV